MLIKNKKLYLILAGMWGALSLLLIIFVHMLNIYPGTSSVSEENGEWTVEQGMINSEVITFMSDAQDAEVTVRLAEQRFDQLEQTAGFTSLLLIFTTGLSLYVSRMDIQTSVHKIAVSGTFLLSAAVLTASILRYTEARQAAEVSFNALKNFM
ncbi:hypothetical protein [Alkalicoccus saliphilus]|uniref:Uncharacterized protein n=1 Tax=Alkalicoccus saliphilus TaxID=200989 RepID=A0A2T4U7A3_9BACI|nr:hypothetical protein [Alkalicoccus saliphilus]PTL39289.1 hypothetical protein C6Y45_06665 [Alkalicoccus saliphilus]